MPLLVDDATAPHLPLNFRCTLLYADPPTNRGLNEGTACDKLDDLDYKQFALNWMWACLRYLQPDSRFVICLNTYLRPLYERIIREHFPLLTFEQEIIWHYEFGTYTTKRFVPSHDNLLIFRQGDPPFNWEDVAIISQRQLAGDSRADWRGRVPGTVWSIPRVPGNSFERRGLTKDDRRSVQPYELVKRIVLAYTDKGDIIFDPFTGHGTMYLVAKHFDRRCYAFDICPEYIEKIKERRVQSLKELLAHEA